MAKKAFTVAVAAATIIATAGLTAFAPVEASAASFGDLIKGETLSTVYYYGSDGQRYAFPSEKTFFSWYEDFDAVVEISDEDLADITLAGNIVARPGSRWIKITSDEKVYAVSADGSIHWIEDEATAEGLAGADWNTNIDDVPDVFFVDYTVGDSLTDASEGYHGMLWTDGSHNYLIWDGELRMLSDDGMSANMFQDGFVLSGEGVDMDALASGDDIDAELALLTDAAQMVETEEYAETEEISVSLSSDSPSASTIIAGQGIAHLASFEFENPTSDDVMVTGVTLDRTGVSSDTTLSAVYLFDGWARVSDSATVSSGEVSWNDSTGLFEIPAGGSYTLAVRSNIASSTSGQTLGLSLDPSAVEFDGAYEAMGSSVESSEHTVASVSNFGTVSFASTTTPSANSSVDPQDDYRVWENTITVGNNEANLIGMRFRNIGSINAEDLGDFRLYVAGVNYGDTVAEEDEDGYIWFDLSADPVEINTGNHVVKVLADIWGGSTRTVTVGMRNAADAIFLEDDYDQPILVQANSTTFSARDAGAQTIASGEVTFTKESDSASGDVTNNSSSVTLASFEVKATGEAMKIESLNFNIAEDDSDTGYRLRNAAIYVDGDQVGSTSVFCGNDTTTSGACTDVSGSAASYSTFTFGSSFVVYPGSPVTMEMVADIYDSSGSNDVADADTIQATIDATNLSSNVLRMTSGSYVTRPSSDVTGNTLTVNEGSFTLAKNTSYANQGVVVPKTGGYKVGSWTISATTTEDVNLTQIDVDFDTDDDADAAVATDDYSNLYIEYGPSDDMVTSNTKTSVSTANSWSIDYTLEAGETIYVNAYADVASGASDSADGNDTIKAELDASGTAPASGTSVSSSDVEGQTITYYNAGTFTTAVAGDTPVAKVVAAGQTVEGAKFKFTSERETYTISEIQVAVDGATDAVAQAAAGVISEIELYDGSTFLGSGVMSQTSGSDTTSASTTNGATLITGLSVEVASGTSKTITAKIVLNDIETGGAASQNDLALTLDTVKYADSQGAETTSTTNRTGNEVRAYNSLPTVAHVDLTNSTIVNGQAMDMYKFTITADSNGDIALKQLAFPISFTDADADTLVVESWKLYKNGTDVSTSSTAVAIEDEDGTDLEGTTDNLVEGDTTVYVIWDTSEEVISAGETVTYTLRATPQGFDSDGDTGDEDYFTIYLSGDASHNSNGGTPGLTDVCLDDTGSGNIWELGDTAAIGTDCSATDTNNSAYNFIWSDLSLSGHDGTETTAPDWANGYLIKNLDLDGETWAK